MNKVRADFTLSDFPLPEGFDPGAYSWRVDLRYSRRRMSGVRFFTGSQFGEPSARDVLEVLLMEATCAEYEFEDWCADLGLDSDSRRAESDFRACVAQSARLRQLLGADFDEAMSDPETWTKSHTENEE